MGARGVELVPSELAVYDLPEVQRGFVSSDAADDELREACNVLGNPSRYAEVLKLK